jgi:hypothetical protein
MGFEAGRAPISTFAAQARRMDGHGSRFARMRPGGRSVDTGIVAGPQQLSIRHSAGDGRSAHGSPCVRPRSHASRGPTRGGDRGRSGNRAAVGERHRGVPRCSRRHGDRRLVSDALRPTSGSDRGRAVDHCRTAAEARMRCDGGHPRRLAPLCRSRASCPGQPLPHSCDAPARARAANTGATSADRRGSLISCWHVAVETSQPVARATG